MSDEAVAGRRAILFGKLPAHGDFVARNLNAAERTQWDDWASRGLEAAREALGEAFDEQHDAAPAWRFIGAPGPFGEAWRAGALAPSIDAAGRRFMILVAAEGLSREEAAADGEAIAGAMEELIYQAFESDWSADALIEAARAALGRWRAIDPEAARARCWTLGAPGRVARTIEGDLEGALAELVAPPSPEAVP